MDGIKTRNRCMKIRPKFVIYKIIIKCFRITGLLPLLPDKVFLKMYYPVIMNEELDLKNPRTFNQKLQWLKLYNRKPEYTTMVDKYAVKGYVSEKIGAEYVIPTLGVWDSFDDIDFDSLPNQFVLKCTHDSGGLVICRDKSKLDIAAAKKKINMSLKRDYFYNGREWPYKNVPKRIIAEQYLSNDEESNELSDYKVLCFNGEPKLIEIHKGRFSGHHTQDFYDTEWNKTAFEQPEDPLSDEIMQKPVFADKMFELSRILAENIPHVRIDWYYTGGKLLFGEITFFDGSGFCPFIENQDEILGNWITLPQKTV